MSYSSDEKLAIFGSAGAIGSNMVQAALTMGLTPNVAMYDPFDKGNEGAAEEIYHCAAQAIVKSCANDPYTTFDINVMGTVALMEACRNSGNTVRSIVVSTSDKSFGHTPPPYNEDTRLNPMYTYEVSKACQHMAALNYFNNYGVPVMILASSNVYGPGDPNYSRIIPNTIRRLAKAAESFGRGIDVPDFKPQGAAEVRLAARSFLQMRSRICRKSMSSSISGTSSIFIPNDHVGGAPQ